MNIYEVFKSDAPLIGEVDGVNTLFSFGTYVKAKSVYVVQNAIALLNGVDYDLVKDSSGFYNQINFYKPPYVDDKLVVDYEDSRHDMGVLNKYRNSYFIRSESLRGVKDNANRYFYLTRPAHEGFVALFINGIRQLPEKDYYLVEEGGAGTGHNQIFLIEYVPGPTDFIQCYFIPVNIPNPTGFAKFNEIHETHYGTSVYHTVQYFKPESLRVYYDGLRLKKDFDFVIASSVGGPKDTIVLNFSPEDDHRIVVDYLL